MLRLSPRERKLAMGEYTTAYDNGDGDDAVGFEALKTEEESEMVHKSVAPDSIEKSKKATCFKTFAYQEGKLNSAKERVYRFYLEITEGDVRARPFQCIWTRRSP